MVDALESMVQRTRPNSHDHDHNHNLSPTNLYNFVATHSQHAYTTLNFSLPPRPLSSPIKTITILISLLPSTKMQPDYPPNWPLPPTRSIPLKPSLIPRGSHHCREDDMSMLCYLKHVLHMSDDELVHEWLRRRESGMRRARMAALCECASDHNFVDWEVTKRPPAAVKQSLVRRWAAIALEVLEHGVPDDLDYVYDSFSDSSSEEEEESDTATATSSIPNDKSNPLPTRSMSPLTRIERHEGDALKWFWAQDVSDDKKLEGLIGRDVAEYWVGEDSDMEEEEEEEDDNEDYEYDVVNQRVTAAAHARGLYLAGEVGSGDMAGDSAYNSAIED
ncbi:hypothetical protein TI39_contig283g00002 [Zymoseptoria brevis]|uniref:Uncharacterized protein n=1 Tax=Zymoseptoria brevis TaxID=1047168 RepID=A0A0F4GWP4_9PEZI|nr:hypothetical protein TI39_contig283g00002 [Zymoseptoria brevis]